MNALRPNLKGLVAICASAFLIATSLAQAQAQEAQPQRMLTIADCPSGYVLAVQDTDSLLPLARDSSAQANPNAYATVDGQMAAFKAQQQQEATYTTAQAQAPRAFVTGCVPRQPQQPRQ